MTRRRWSQLAAAAALLAAMLGVLVLVGPTGASTDAGALAHNPDLDPGTPLPDRPAPNFTLRDQFGRPVSLRAQRGRVVLLAFTDSECTTVCPLTTTAMLDAQRMLGAAGASVTLLGIDVNPKATSTRDVLRYTELHGLLGHWRFLTGPLPRLRRVWQEYAVDVGIQGGKIEHTPALVVIDPRGRMRMMYLTQQSYAAVGQLGQLLATEASRLLPGHPRVRSHLTYTVQRGITPAQPVSLPTVGGQRVHLGPGAPHLTLFFATWDQEVTDLGARLDALDRYDAADGGRLPRLTAIDEASVEPSGSALHNLLAHLTRPLTFPVALDRSGRVADGYEVQDQPWLVLTSPTGRILWYQDVGSVGWPSTGRLVTDVKAALARVATGVPGSSALRRLLRGSPPALAALHAQAGQLLGSESALVARIHALRGHPVVVNAWASWCRPCAAEFAWFAAASASDGSRVAFIGADTDDSPGDARAFLARHPVSYPSYETTSLQLRTILPAGLEGLPTTLYFNAAGRLVGVHAGQYADAGALDADIQRYTGVR